MATRRKAASDSKHSPLADACPTLPSKSDTTTKPKPAKTTAKRKTAGKPRTATATKATAKTTAKTSAKTTAKTSASSATAEPKKRARRAPRHRAAPARAEDVAAGETPRQLSAEERYRMVQDAAYYIAERHGFEGDPISFWLEAEREVDEQHRND